MGKECPAKKNWGLLYRRGKYWQAKTTDIHPNCQKKKKSQSPKTLNQEQPCARSWNLPGMGQTHLWTQGMSDNCPDHIWHKHLFLDNWVRASLACFLLLLKETYPFQAGLQTPIPEGNLFRELKSIPLSFSFSSSQALILTHPSPLPTHLHLFFYLCHIVIRKDHLHGHSGEHRHWDTLFSHRHIADTWGHEWESTQWPSIT